MVPELEEDELEQNVQPMVLEYFEHGDTGEVVVRQGRGGPWGGGGPRGRAPAAGKGSIAGGSPQGGAASLVEAVGGTAVTEGLWGRAAGRGGAGLRAARRGAAVPAHHEPLQGVQVPAHRGPAAPQGGERSGHSPPARAGGRGGEPGLP